MPIDMDELEDLHEQAQKVMDDTFKRVKEATKSWSDDDLVFARVVCAATLDCVRELATKREVLQ